MLDGVRLSVVGDDDLGQPLDLLNEAAAWLRSLGVEQWPTQFAADWLRASHGVGEMWLARQNGVAIGTITVATSDPLWPDDAAAL